MKIVVSVCRQDNPVRRANYLEPSERPKVQTVAGTPTDLLLPERMDLGAPGPDLAPISQDSLQGFLRDPAAVHAHSGMLGQIERQGF
jgi:hypothetical protein